MEKFVNSSAVLDTALLIDDGPDIRIILYGTQEDSTQSFMTYLNDYKDESLSCVTLTMLPAHWAKFKQYNISHKEMFMYYLINKNVEGIFTIEYTKRGVPHLHGLLHNISERDKDFWGAQACVKKMLRDDDYHLGWIRYCVKDKITEEMNEMFSIQIKKKKLMYIHFLNIKIEILRIKIYSNIIKQNGVF